MKKIIFLLVLLACSTRGFSQTPAQNKAKVNDFYAAFNGDFSKFDASKFVTTDFVDYSVSADVWEKMGTNGVTRFQAIVGAFKFAFPDLQVKVVKMVAEGNTVMAYYEMSGTFKNEFMGIKPNNKSFKILDVDIVDFNREGKSTGHWAVQDQMVMWAQLGVEMK